MVKLFFVGDVFCRKKNQDTDLISKELSNIISEHDVKCCNLEAPIIEETMNIKKTEKIGPSLCQNCKVVDELIKSGFNMFSIANNHIMDYGIEGLNNTIKYLKNQTVIGAGNDIETAYKTYIYDKDNIKIGFLSIAENGFGACIERNEYGYAWMKNKIIQRKIQDLKEKCNYVIINCHAGAELFKYPLPEIKELYKSFIDVGANIIIGHHPHIIQGYENYKNGIIFYSLGNFIFTGQNREECRKSYCVSIELEEEKYNWKVIPVIFKDGQVLLEKSKESFKKIQELSKETNSNKYIEQVNKFCIKMYNETYKQYYLASFNINRDNIINKIKSCIKLLFNLKEDNELIMYHNLVIETHLWICKRALKIINK